MCHVILFAIPFLALPVFWIFPLSQALLIYSAVLFFSLLLFWKIVQALMGRVITGKEGLLGAQGKILEVKRGNSAKVEVGNEIWNADSKHSLWQGQWVTVKRVEGLLLIVEPVSASSNFG